MSVTLKVSAKGVHVGQINSDEYDALKKAIYKDYRSHLAQLFFVTLGVLKIMAKSMMMTPIVLFWAVVLIFMFDPNATIASVYPYLNDPRGVAESLKTILSISFVISFFLSLFGVIYANPLKSAYKKLIDSELRKRFDFNIPYDTELFIFNPDNL